MATIKVPKAELKRLIKSEPELIEKINLMGTPIESVSENEMEIQVLPNRADCLSVQGFLRAFKAYCGKEPGLKKYKVNAPEKDFKVKIDSSVKDVRPFTACAIVKNLKFDDTRIKEIIDMQEKLHTTVGRNRKKAAIGIYPLEKVTLPIRYEARSPKDIKFIPLESDREMTGLEILQRHPTGRTYAYLLDGQNKFPVFVDAKNKILSMPPIINSHETGKITPSTRDVFIECSGFDFNVLKKILNIIVSTLADMGGKIYAMELYHTQKEITPDLEPEKMKISLENANKLLGLSLKDSDLDKLLPKMGYEYKSSRVSIPAWRIDVLHEVDIIEDIAIAYGYDKLVPEIPSVATLGEESKSGKVKSKLSEILIGLGFVETSSYHLIKADEAQRIKSDEKLELLDSKTDYKFLRPNLLVPNLRILSENKDNEYPQKIFEIGSIFAKDNANKTETGIAESDHLIVLASPGNFTEIKQILDYISKMLDVKYIIEEGKKDELIEGRTASLKINNKVIGYLGEMHPETLRSWNIKMPISVLEISLEEIYALMSD